jgi:hypothetical protein
MSNTKGPSSTSPEEYILGYEPVPDVEPMIQAGLQCIDALCGGIPITSSLYNVVETAKSLKDYMFQAKIQTFALGCCDISKRKVTSFLETFSSAGERKKIGLTILMLLDNADSIEKSDIIARAFCQLIKGQITLEFYIRLCHMINRAHYSDFIHLRRFIDENTEITSINNFGVPENTLTELFVCGFLSDKGFDGGSLDPQGDCGTIYILNEYGLALRNLL